VYLGTGLGLGSWISWNGSCMLPTPQMSSTTFLGFPAWAPMCPPGLSWPHLKLWHPQPWAGHSGMVPPGPTVGVTGVPPPSRHQVYLSWKSICLLSLPAHRGQIYSFRHITKFSSGDKFWEPAVCRLLL
jgi:hypothetical protein